MGGLPRMQMPGEQRWQAPPAPLQPHLPPLQPHLPCRHTSPVSPYTQPLVQAKARARAEAKARADKRGLDRAEAEFEAEARAQAEAGARAQEEARAQEAEEARGREVLAEEERMRREKEARRQARKVAKAQAAQEARAAEEAEKAREEAESAREEAERAREEAILTLQRVQRGRQDRRKHHLYEDAAKLEAKKKHLAASRIQRQYRGHDARKVLEARREYARKQREVARGEGVGERWVGGA